MSECSHLAQALEGFLADPELSWFVSYPAAVDGLTSEQAACSPGPRFNSVWGVTLHLTICQQFALAVLCGSRIDVDAFFENGAWPPIPNSQDEAAWRKAKADLLAVNHALSECVSELPDKTLEQQLPTVEMEGFQYVQGILAHNSNHLCEIVTIRHMQGLWLDKT